MRRACQPCLVDETGEQSPLRRVDFSDKSIVETFLQTALHRTPQILPVNEFDSAFGPLISLGREIDNIDNLFISPTGRLTIVETKLWRNPEATRQVIAQILDYATSVSSWSYTDLEAKAREALAPAPIGTQSLYEFVSSSIPEENLAEQDFVDAVQRTLQTGRFLLLIVGDGIRENIKAMVASLHQHPQELFTFGLVELQVFTDKNLPGKYLIVPQIIANSTEIVRAVVRVQTTGQASVSVEIEEQEPERATGSSRRTLSEDEFFSEIKDTETKAVFRQLIDFSIGLGALPSWRSSSVSIRLPDPAGSRTQFTLYVLTTSGELYTGWMLQQLKSTKRPPAIAIDYITQICSVFSSLSPKKGYPDRISRSLHAREISGKFDDFTQVVRDVVERLKATE